MTIWQRTRVPVCGALALTALALGACSNNVDDGIVNPNLSCGAPRGTVVVSYPAPGATGIPDNFQGVVFASTNGLSGSYEAFVVANGSSVGEYFEPVVTVSSPLPSPNATPTFANPIYQESAVPPGNPPLSAATTYGIYLNDTNSDCTPQKLLGTFTTQ